MSKQFSNKFSIMENMFTHVGDPFDALMKRMDNIETRQDST